MSDFTLFTSESVSEGHPDKLADQISDAVLDALLEKDQKSRVALETFVTRGLCVVGGELTTTAYVEIADVVRDTIKAVGYTKTDYGFDGDGTYFEAMLTRASRVAHLTRPLFVHN